MAPATEQDSSGGFTAEEKAAMKERAAELRAQKGGRKKEADLQTLLDKIAEMPPADQEVAAGLHTLVTETAPELEPRTWYGMPAYARNGKVLLFLQPAEKFGTRYCTLGFNDNAQLDDGDMWPTGYAVTQLTPAVRERVAALVTRAVG
jgi:uncharacterized protein YdhG (YjbR/CyaY superfamily)